MSERSRYASNEMTNLEPRPDNKSEDDQQPIIEPDAAARMLAYARMERFIRNMRLAFDWNSIEPDKYIREQREGWD